MLKEKENPKQMFKGRIFRSYECNMWIQKTQWSQVRRAKCPGKPHNTLSSALNSEVYAHRMSPTNSFLQN